jgi:hypothetical protein
MILCSIAKPYRLHTDERPSDRIFHHIFKIYRQIRLLNAVKLVTALDLFGRHGAHPLDA